LFALSLSTVVIHGCASNGGENSIENESSGGSATSWTNTGSVGGAASSTSESPTQGGAINPPSSNVPEKCPDATRLGGFSLTLESGYTSISGKFVGSVVQRALFTEVGSASACTLIKRENPRCSPTCETGYVCSKDAVCVTEPKSQSVGAVTIAGLSANVSMVPVQPGNSYFLSGTNNVPHPGFAPNAVVNLSAAGADLPHFVLRAIGVAPLKLIENAWRIEKGQPLSISWDPGTVTMARVRITLNVDQHGNSPVTMTCSTEDDGKFDIPSTLIDALIDFGVTGFPMGHAYRENASSVDLAGGCVELILGAHAEATLQVAGFTPCDTSHPCPSGKTCNLTTEICQ
jgi:hypothetical protein